MDDVRGWISVAPTNYRRIALRAIEAAHDPRVLCDRREVTDFSEAGPLTQRGIGGCRDFEIRDGAVPILGFHDHPREMFVNEAYAEFARFCAEKGWLRIDRPAP